MPSKQRTELRSPSIQKQGRSLAKKVAEAAANLFVNFLRVNADQGSGYYERIFVNDGDIVVHWADKQFHADDPHGSGFNNTGAMIVLQAFNDTELADNNVAGLIRGMANNDAATPENTTYVDLYLQASDISDGSEQGTFYVVTQHGGSDAFVLAAIGNRVVQLIPTSAIADAALLNGQMSLYWDDTNKRIKAKVKNASGTVYEGNVSDVLT